MSSEYKTKFDLKANEEIVFTEENINFEITNLSDKLKKICIEIK